MTPRRGTDTFEPPYHVLDFFHDDEDNSALTVLCHGVRFHLIVEADRVINRKFKEPMKEYQRLLQRFKYPKDDSRGRAADGSDAETDSPTDSAVDATDPTSNKFSRGPEAALHEWMIDCLKSAMKRLAPETKNKANQSLEEWYNCPTHFFQLEIAEDGIKATELETAPDLEERMNKLRPHLMIPKYIQTIDVPRHSANDLVILSCSNELALYHPCRVRLRGDETETAYFLKLIDPTQPQPNKREIRLLDRIFKLNLHHQIRCPKLEALVTFPSKTKNSIMGFLQTDIKNPVPLTSKLDPSVSQHQRETWAKEAACMKAALHEKGIIWGDAKADNFMVDENDELWIIDFGGSYTEGWIDPELKDTEEGDDMGVAKIVNALQDPVKNTVGSDDEESERSKSQSRKRKAGNDDMIDELMRRTTKTPRLFVTQPAEDEVVFSEDHGGDSDGEGDPTYCYCLGQSSGDMIACDNPNCSMEWFHFTCAGITSPPPKGEKWFCAECLSEE